MMDKLKNQLKEEYGRLTYTYTAYHKMRDRNIRRDALIKVLQIALTAISTTGFIATLISNILALSWVGGAGAALSLFLHLYTKDFKLLEDAKVYKTAADELWLLRQRYMCFLCRFDSMDEETIKEVHNGLLLETDRINKSYPGTDAYGYRKARNALKNKEEQFFSDAELDQMLPKSLREK